MICCDPGGPLWSAVEPVVRCGPLWSAVVPVVRCGAGGPQWSAVVRYGPLWSAVEPALPVHAAERPARGLHPALVTLQL